MYIKIDEAPIENFKGKSVLLFGAGSCGLKSIEEFEKIGARIEGFIDNNRSKRGEKIGEYTIYSPEDIKNFDNVNIMITSTFVDEIKLQLSDMGISNVYTVRLGALRDTLQKGNFFKPFLSCERANEMIYNGLMSDDPFFVGRIGSTELECLTEYYYLLDRVHGGRESYHDNLKMIMWDWTGFYPPTDELMDRFSRLYIEDAKDIDLLWCMWLSRFENMLYRDYISEKPIGLYDDTAFPINIKDPWTRALKGKKVLVIHPFEDSITQNYHNLDKLFEHEFLPDFELRTLKAVQSIAGEKPEFDTWFDALEYMERKVDTLDFDIALIGAGGYGFPLGAYIKRIGRKAVHIGGMLQLYFGIKGKAWNDLGIYNEYWTLPMETERPDGYRKVEAGRYW